MAIPCPGPKQVHIRVLLTSICSNCNTCEIGVLLCRCSRKSSEPWEKLSADWKLRGVEPMQLQRFDVNTSADQVHAGFLDIHIVHDIHHIQASLLSKAQ
jgi:hypothetical protein